MGSHDYVKYFSIFNYDPDNVYRCFIAHFVANWTYFHMQWPILSSLCKFSNFYYDVYEKSWLWKWSKMYISEYIYTGFRQSPNFFSPKHHQTCLSYHRSESFISDVYGREIHGPLHTLPPKWKFELFVVNHWKTFVVTNFVLELIPEVSWMVLNRLVPICIYIPSFYMQKCKLFNEEFLKR